MHGHFSGRCSDRSGENDEATFINARDPSQTPEAQIVSLAAEGLEKACAERHGSIVDVKCGIERPSKWQIIVLVLAR